MAFKLDLSVLDRDDQDEKPAGGFQLDLSILGEPEPEPPGFLRRAADALTAAGKAAASGAASVAAAPGKAVADLILHPTDPSKDLGRRVVGALRATGGAATEVAPEAVTQVGKAAAPFAGAVVGSLAEAQAPSEAPVEVSFTLGQEIERAAIRAPLQLAQPVGTAMQFAGTVGGMVRRGAEAVLPEGLAPLVPGGLSPDAVKLLQDTGREITDFWRKEEEQFQRGEDVSQNIIDRPSLVLNPKWLIPSVIETAPTLAASIIPGMAGGRAIQVGGKVLNLTPALIAKLARIGGAIFGGFAGGSLEGAQTYEEVLRRGGTPEEAAAAATQMTLASAALNAISLDRILPKRSVRLAQGAKTRLQRLKEILTAGGVEGFTEWLEGPAEALILGDPVVDRALEELNVVPPSFILGGGAKALSGVRTRAPARFVGYDNTQTDTTPVFMLTETIGEADRGSLVRGQDLIAAGFTLPKHPKPKSGQPLPSEETQAEPAEPEEDILAASLAAPPALEPGEPQKTPVAATPAPVERPGDLEEGPPAAEAPTIPRIEEVLGKAAEASRRGEEAVKKIEDLAAKAEEPPPLEIPPEIAEEPVTAPELPVRAEEPVRPAPVETRAPKPTTPEPVTEVEAPPAAVGPERALNIVSKGKVVRVTFPDASHKDLFNYAKALANDTATPQQAQLVAASLGVPTAGDVGGIASRYRNAVIAGVRQATGTFEAPRYDAAQGRPAAPPAAPPATRTPLAVAPPTTPAVESISVQPQTGFGESNKVFTKDVAEAARERIRAKLRGETLTAGIDPTLLKDMVELGGYYFEGGVREFGAWSRQMVEDIGEGIREYLRPAFNQIEARYAETETIDEEIEGGEAVGEDTEAPGVVPADEPGAPDQGPLEGAQATDVPGAGEVGAPGQELVRRPGEDLGGVREPGEGGRPGGPGVGVGQGGVGVPPVGIGRAEPVAAEPATEPGAEPAAETERRPPAEPGRDYRITDEAGLAPGGPKQRFRANVDALRLVAKLRAEGRPATPEEQAMLVRYVGWGGLKGAFDPRAEWNQRHEWYKERQELKQLVDEGVISEDEFREMRATVLNAHYTSFPVVRAMWAALERLGFTGGRVLEPAAGIGHFRGLMPAETIAGSRWAMVEKDPVTGAILRALYPRSNPKVQPFEEARIPDNFFDVAVGNVPFLDVRVYDPTMNGKKYQRMGLNQTLHDYFFAKSIDKVRPGGVLAFITSTGTLDKKADHVRAYLASQAEFLGAIRLPNTAFKESAGTEVTTDIVFLRKREAPIPMDTAREESWVQVGTVAVQPQRGESVWVPMNQWLIQHPEMVLGTIAGDELYSANQRVAVESDGRDLAAALEEAIGRLPEGVLTPPPTHAATDPSNPATIEAQVTTAVKPNGYAIGQDGLLYRNVVEKGRDPRLEVVTLPVDDMSRITGMLGIRDAAREVLRVQLQNGTDEEVTSAQKTLNQKYDAFVKQWTTARKVEGKRVVVPGYLHSRKNIRAFLGDPDGGFLRSLERWDARGKQATKADIFTKRTLPGNIRETEAKNAKHALLIALNEGRGVDWGRMTELTNKDPEELQADLAGEVFENPESGWETAEEYLSGNVRRKLEAARGAAEMDQRYQSNVVALEAVQPRDLEPKEIQAQIGASWIPKEDLAAFLGDILEINPTRVAVSYAGPLNYWSVRVDGHTIHGSYTATSKWGTGRVNAVQLLQLTLNLQRPTVYDRMEDGGRVLNVQATTEARDRQIALRDKFAEWIWSDESRASRLAQKFNVEFNSTMLRSFNGSYLTLPGKALDVSLRDAQLNAIHRILVSGNTLLAHIVGAGKTWIMVGAAMESKRLGLAKKPMMVVPNHMVKQFEREFRRMYPAANLLVAGEQETAAEEGRGEFMSRIATGVWDAVIVPHSSFSLLPVSRQTYIAHINEQLDEMRQALIAVALEEGKKARVVRDIERAIARLETKLKERLKAEEKDVTITFEELGIDQLYVDEAHLFKNLMFTTRMRNVRGLSSSRSDRASDLFMKGQYITRLNNGRGVVFSTGTPISNTMAEMYTMQRYLDFAGLRERGWGHFDAWAGTFGQTVAAPEMTVDGRFRETTRFAKFVNMPELATLFREFADVQLDPEELGLQRPRVRGAIMPEDDPWAAQTPGLPERHDGKVEVILSPMSDAQISYMIHLGERGEAVRHGVDPRHDNMLKIAGDGRKNALDARLVMPQAPEHPQSKANLAASNIHALWEETKAERLTQIVFLDLATPKAKTGKARREPWQMSLKQFARSRKLDLGTPGGQSLAQVAHGVEVLQAIMAGKPVTKDIASPYVDNMLVGEVTPEVRAAVEAIMAGRPNPITAEQEDPESEVIPETEEERRMRESVYQEIKTKLVQRGVPADEVAFIHDAKTKAAKQALFDSMNEGHVRVLLGSTDKLGMGTNVQQRLYLLHHIDAPWRPADIEQREGRMLRPGNLNSVVRIFQYVSQGREGTISFDSFMWQTLEAKAKFIRQAMKGDLTNREAEDIAVDFDPAIIKALSTGNPLIIERENVNSELRLLEIAKRAHINAVADNQRRLAMAKTAVEEIRRRLEGVEADIALRDQHAEGPFSIQLRDESVTDKDAANARLKVIFDEEVKQAKFRAGASIPIGVYKGFRIEVRTTESGFAWLALVGRGAPHTMNAPSVASADAILRNLDPALIGTRATFRQDEKEVAGYEEEIAKPFPKEQRYRDLTVRKEEIERELGITRPHTDRPFDPAESEDAEETGGDSPDEEIDRFVGRFLRRFQQGPSPAPAAQATRQQERKDSMIRNLNEARRLIGAGGLVLQGGFRGRGRTALGLHFPGSGNIRLAHITDIDTYAHEAGHALQGALGITKAGLIGFKSEIRAAFNVTYRQARPNAPNKLREGFAEFVRFYLTDPATAQRVAPTFTPWFERRLATKPEMAQALRDFRDATVGLRSEPDPIKRMEAGLAFPEPRPRPAQRLRELSLKSADGFFRRALRRLRFEIADKFLPLREIEEIVSRGTLRFGGLSFYKLHRTMSPRAYAVSRRFIAEGVVGFHSQAIIPGTKGLKQILEPIWDRRRLYEKYEIARRIRSLEQTTARSPETIKKHRDTAEHLRNLLELRRGQGAPDPVADVIARLETRHPDFLQVLADIQTWNDGLLQYMADSGNYSQEAIDAIRAANEVYVPLHRLAEDEETAPSRHVVSEGTGGATVNVRRTIKTLEGRSERMILPPIEQRYRQAITMIAAAERNDAAATLFRALADPGAKGLNLGEFMDLVPMPIQAIRFPLDRIKKTLVAGGLPVTLLGQIDLTTIATVFSPTLSRLGRNEVVAWVDGAPKVAQVHDSMLLRALTQVDRRAVNEFLRGFNAAFGLLRTLSSVLRRTVITHPNFLVGNLVRDQQTVMVQARGILPGYVKGLIDAFEGGKIAKQYSLGGGEMFSIARMDERSIRRSLDDLMHGRWRKGNRVMGTLQLIEEFTELFEMPTRVGVARTTERLLSPAERAESSRIQNVELAYQGREASVDFGMSGASPVFQAWSGVTAFLRPMVNGMYKAARFLREAIAHPTGWQARRLAGVGVTMMLVESLLYVINKDDERWKHISDEEKTLNWILIADPMTKAEWNRLTAAERLKRMDNIYKVPRDYVFGMLFGTIPRSVVEALDRKDPEYLTRTLGKVLGFGVSEVLPTGVRPALEVATGYDFFRDRAVEPERIRDRPATERSTAYTTEVAKTISRSIGGALSPIQIDHLIRGYTGTVGADTARAVSAIQGLVDGSAPPQPAWRLSDYPVLARFIRRFPSARSQQIEDFYTIYGQARGALAEHQDAMRTGDKARAARVQARWGFEITQAGRLEAEAEGFAETRREMDAMRANKKVLPQAKRDKLDAITLRELDRASRIMDQLKAARARYEAAR